MPIKQTAKYRLLSQVIGDFGKTTQVRYPTHFLKFSMPVENIIQARFQSIVNFGHQNVFLEMKKKYADEAVEIIGERIKQIAEEYKTLVEAQNKLQEPHKQPYEEAPPKTIKLVLDTATIQESIEYLSRSIYNPIGAAHYRLTCLIKVT